MPAGASGRLMNASSAFCSAVSAFEVAAPADGAATATVASTTHDASRMRTGERRALGIRRRYRDRRMSTARVDGGCRRVTHMTDVAVVTGVGGMGMACARRLGAGRHVVLADFDEAKLQSV